MLFPLPSERVLARGRGFNETLGTLTPPTGRGSPTVSRQSGCARVPSWSRRWIVQDLVRQVGGWVDIAQRRDDLLTHEPDRAYELFVLKPTKHHPVADVGDANTGGTFEFFDDG